MNSACMPLTIMLRNILVADAAPIFSPSTSRFMPKGSSLETSAGAALPHSSTGTL